MYPVSDNFLSSIRRSHVVKSKIEIYDVNNGTIISEAQPVSGEVTIDNRRTVRRMCNLEFVDVDGSLVPSNNRSSVLLPYNREIKIYRGVVYADGTEELVPLGVFIITSVEITDTEQGIKINISGSDRSLRLIRAKFTNHEFYIDENTPKEKAIEDMLRFRFPNIQTIFPFTNQVTPIIYPTLDQSSDPWREAQKIAKSAAMDLYFDENGICRMRPIPDPDLGLPLITYEDGIDSVLTSLSRSLSTDDTFNAVIYTGEGTNLSIGVIGEAYDENPASPTYRYTYGETPLFKSSPLILTVAEAQEAAEAELRKVIGASEQINWNQLVNPAHDVFDLVKITRLPSGLDATLMLDSVSIPLGPDQTMNAVGRTRRF
jgi:hypothetical protein